VAPPTDPQIRKEVEAALLAADLREVTVDVKDGVVTLGGRAPDDTAVARAKERAGTILGVRSVVIEIRVEGPATQLPADEDGTVTARLKFALLADPRLAGSQITPSVRSGVATLTGTAPTEPAKAAAGEIAQRIEGVTSVVNQIQVTQQTVESVPDPQIEKEVSAVLDTDFADYLLTISVRNGTVKVRGAVGSRQDMIRIADAISRVKGVKNVDTSLLTVEGGEPGEQRVGSPVTNARKEP
jgi:hyperosmotically inducible protein